MLLRHTTEKTAERNALTINPAKTCQPIGAMYAALGIHGCIPHSHGSQGCCAYHRSALTRHFKEPVMAGTSSFTEGSSVFGGQANLLQAINNLFTIYDPQVIAIHSTCLSETIGDDLNQIAQKARDDGRVPEGKYIIYANTPSYVGSHITGYSNMVSSMASSFAESGMVSKNGLNLIAGWMEPSDMREIKRMTGLLTGNFTLFPDMSDVLDAPQTGEFTMYPKGGTTVEQLKGIGDRAKSLALGKFCTEAAAQALDRKFKIPYTVLDIPIGISATDRFLMTLSNTTCIDIPQTLTDERGRVVDVITDMQQYFYGKRVALWGDPDTLVPLVEFLLTLEMRPVYIVSGTPGKAFDRRIRSIVGDKVPNLKLKSGPQADMFLMHQWIKKEPVDLIIGNTYGKYISRDEDIPFIRHGFPILDRIGHSYMPTVGYAGAMRLVEKLLSVLMDHQDRNSTEESFELVM